MLSREQKKEYLKRGGISCPYCKSEDIDAGRMEFEGDVYQSVKCNSCGETWDDQYKLVDVLSV